MEIVKARLRKGKDDDIREGMKNLPPYYDHSDFVRDAIRLKLQSINPNSNNTKCSKDVNEENDTTELYLKKMELSDEEAEIKLNKLLGI